MQSYLVDKTHFLQGLSAAHNLALRTYDAIFLVLPQEMAQSFLLIFPLRILLAQAELYPKVLDIQPLLNLELPSQTIEQRSTP